MNTIHRNSQWTPTFFWHAKLFGVLLVICTLMLAAGWYITNRLPQPYQPKKSAPQATPWKGPVQENL